jgi:hypothetical protein
LCPLNGRRATRRARLSVLGAGLVAAGFSGYGPAAISAGALILLATLLFIRNATGLLIILACQAISWTMVMFLPREFAGHVSIALGLALLVGSVRDKANVISVHIHRRDRLDTSDAYLLFRRTMIPSLVWLLMFAATIGWAWLSAYGSFRHLIAAAAG